MKETLENCKIVEYNKIEIKTYMHICEHVPNIIQKEYKRFDKLFVRKFFELY